MDFYGAQSDWFGKTVWVEEKVPKVNCTASRYIKLGGKGQWNEISLQNGELHFGYGNVPHELALTLDREQIKKYLIKNGRDAQRASEETRQVVDFYSLDASCVWITFSQGYMWWTFADPEVTWLGKPAGHGDRMRKSIGGWRNTDTNKVPLRMQTLSTRLTQIANYRRTICTVEATDYLMRRINGVQEPIILQANKARDALLSVTAEAITTLHWRDFEILVDVVFARSGWHRASTVGGLQTTHDLVLEQPTTKERAAVQVKSQTTQQVLDKYIQQCDQTGTFSRIFFVCHSPKGPLVAPDRPDVHVWAGREFASTVLRLGLHEWVLERVA